MNPRLLIPLAAALVLAGCTRDRIQHGHPDAERASADVEVTLDAEADGGTSACSTPQPTCDSITPDSVSCCTQVTPCGVCYGDGITSTECADGQWVCGAGRQLLTACTQTWSPLGDAGPFPTCDGDAGTDAGSCHDIPPADTPFCRACYGDLATRARCVEGAWACEGRDVLSSEYATRCAGVTGGPCLADGTCAAPSQCARGTCLPPCGSRQRCRRVPDDAMPTACECEKIEPVCRPPPDPNSAFCPDGTILAETCTSSVSC